MKVLTCELLWSKIALPQLRAPEVLPHTYIPPHEATQQQKPLIRRSNSMHCKTLIDQKKRKKKKASTCSTSPPL